MISNIIRPRILAAGIAACLATTAATQAGPVVTGSVRAASAKSVASAEGKTYIVMFSEPSVALHNRALRSGKARSSSATGAIPFATKPNGRAYMDMRSDNARNYRAGIVAAQAGHQRSIEGALGRSAPFARTYQYAINGAALVLSDKEAKLVRSLPGVIAVTPSRTLYPDDDVSSRFIGADALWRGANRRPPSAGFTYPTLDSLFGDLNQGSGFKGDGVVIGVIDTGYNSMSPSFQATDASGYTVTNPLGSGTYLGDCGVSSISFGGCNDKVIAVYDSYKRGLGKTGVNVEDTNGHGSHTASTAGGNGRSGSILGFSANLSGIAPHANLSIFRIVTPGVGTATDASELAAIEDAISDQVVDVLNMSFGGCAEPNYWGDPVSLGFLAAQDANIFTALSAGNTRPVTQCARQQAQTPGTLGNAMPWVTTVAATTPPAGEATMQLSLTGPGTPPLSTQGLSMTEGTFDLPLSGPLPGNTPIVLSPQFDAGDPGSPSAPSHGADGCTGYPANTFNGAIALISRGGCTFAVKITNVLAAGGIAAVIADNRVEGPFSPTVGPPTVGIPVFSIVQADGLAVGSYLGSNGGTGTASMGYPTSRPAAQGDVLAGFSLIGPVLTPVPFNVIKPDIAAPGVGTLAAYSNAFETTEGLVVGSDTPDIVAFDSGTSMASPHIAGAAALLVQAHPDWTAAEIKSALMMTAVQGGVTKADGLTPAGVYDVGSGRVQVDNAAAAGLVLDETGSNFFVGDPTQGGDASTFNIASMQNFNCAGKCTFTRTFRNTQDHDVTWVATVGGPLASAITVSPSNFTAKTGGTVTLTITVDSRGLLAGGSYSTASLQLTPPTPQPGYQPLSDLHLPISVAVPAPAVATSSNVVNIDLAGNASGSATLNFSNIGGGKMNFAPQSWGTAPLVWVDQKDNLGYYNLTSTHFVDPGTGDLDQLLADDFVISGGSVDLGTIVTPGAAVHPLTSFGSSLGVHWRIYPDDNGLPGAQAAWSYDATAGSPGVSVANDVISLDLAAAGQSTGLAGGRYWLVVYPDLPCNDSDGNGCTEGWGWDTSWYGNGTNWAYISSDPSAQWSNDGTDVYGPGLAMTITTRATCGDVPSWLTLSQGGSGLVVAPTPTPITFTAAKAGYAPDTSASTYVCFGTTYQDPSLLTQVPKDTIAIQVNAKN